MIRALKLLPLVIVLGVAVYFGWQFLDDAQRFPIRHVKIYSPFQYTTQQEIQKIVKPFAQESFFMLSVKELQNQLLKNPWIYRVKLSRAWPDLLTVKVKEQTPFARWGSDGLINGHGDLFKPSSIKGFDDLPLLSGPDEELPKVLSYYRGMSDDLRALNLKIETVKMSKRGAWEVTLNNGVFVLLGNDRPLTKWQQFIVIYPKLQEKSDKPISRVDMRYPSGMAIRRGRIKSEVKVKIGSPIILR